MKRIIAIASLVLVLGACSKDKSVQEANIPNSNPSDLTIIHIHNSAFSPSTLQVGITTMVTWINEDNIVHNVTSDRPLFDSGDIPPGGRFSFTFNAVGGFGYHSARRPEMTGTVSVVAPK